MRPDVLGFLTRRPQTKRELADRMGVSTREVEMLVQEARLGGAPILSDSDGYRVTDDPDEVAEQARRLRHRYITQALTARAMRRAADRMRVRQAEDLRPSGTLWGDAA